ncbi:MAG TPA: hypothetical protein VKY15_04675 [Acidimicrobiales bacterium]|jgi:hypothetical protein|nr:hypothetical protein [Acidimicrobiales bacterium]
MARTTPTARANLQAQLELLIDEEPRDWRLDERTKALGRRGVARARAVLLEAKQRRSVGRAA